VVTGRPTVAVVGLGKMGLAIAERLLDCGFPLAVFNRTGARAEPLAGRGANVLDTASDALGDAEVCITMLADDEALSEVALGAGGIMEGARTGTTLIDMSTVSVEASREVAARATEARVEYLRAPVSGNPGVVRSGNLTILVSGPERAFESMDEVFHAIGKTVLYVGEDERARVAKLILQILIGGTAELLAEAVLLGEAGGIERGKLAEVLGASVVNSPFLAYKSEPLFRDDFSATFTTAMMLKDVDLVLDLARETRVTLPFTQELRGLLEQTIAGGYGDVDFMALYLRLRRLAAAEATTAGAT
jgi:3-hydroxyisobutyrate dehydrogenase-like beta-hydroxyacid dehydrogenase